MENRRKKDYFGKKLSPKESEKVIAELRGTMLGLLDRWLIKGRFHQELGKGTLPMEAIKVFWQNWHGFVAEIKGPSVTRVAANDVCRPLVGE